MFFRAISSLVSVFHQRMDETRDEIISIAAHFKARLLALCRVLRKRCESQHYFSLLFEEEQCVSTPSRAE